MILSTKGRYAVMAMVELAVRDDHKPLSLSVIADKQEIPLAYLEQIFARLKRCGLVHSVRGPGGGYRLSELPAEITVADIIFAAEESIEMTRCGGSSKPGCMAPKTRCLTHDLWEGLTSHIRDYLQSVTLEDICRRQVKAYPALAEWVEVARP